MKLPFEGIMEALRDVNKYADAEVVIKVPYYPSLHALLHSNW